MALDSVSQLGQYIGNRIKDQDALDNNLAPENAEFISTYYDINNNLLLGGNVKGYKWIFDTTAFILDHPVQGELDSAVYKLDSGYRNPTEVHFPLSYPILWDQGYKELIFTQPIIEA